MAIPDHVHPIRLMLACVGIDPPKARPSAAIVLQLISSALELPPTKAMDFMADLRTRLVPLERELTASPESVLRIDGIVDSFTNGLQGSVDRLGRSTTQNIFDNFYDWIISNLKVDVATFGNLLNFAFGRFQAALHKPGARPLVLDELDCFCDALISAAPTAFRAAHAALIAETTPRSPVVVRRQQAAMHPLHHMLKSERHDASGEQYSALLARLQAWADAAETTIYAVAKFVWTIRGYPGSLTTQVPGKNKPIKGNVFNLAAKWCDEHAVPFPFRRDLYHIRNAIAHKHITIADSEVVFHKDDGGTLAALGFDEAAKVIEHDILFASHFAGVLVGAECRHQDRAGDFDVAWAAAKSCIPNLELTTVDIDAIWPTHARLAKFQYQRVATFRTIPARSGRLDGL